MGKLSPNGTKGSSTEVNGRIVTTILRSMEVETAVAVLSLLAPDHRNASPQADFSVDLCIAMLMLTICRGKTARVNFCNNSNLPHVLCNNE